MGVRALPSSACGEAGVLGLTVGRPFPGGLCSWNAGPWPYGRWKSSTGAGLGYTGMYFLRNFRLRSVTLPEPSMRITYWSY